jgi:hypothetical protein
MRRITITDRDTATSLRRKLASKEHEYCKILIKHKHIDLVLSCFRTNRSPAQAHINKFVKKHLTGEFSGLCRKRNASSIRTKED